MGRPGQGLDITKFQGWIGRRFQKQQAGFRSERLYHLCVVGRVHDLYALFGTAAVQSGPLSEDPPVILYRLVYLDNKVDDRDRIASLHAPADTSITWRDLETVGTYALKLVWGDGHDTGIYTFRYLRDLCRCYTCRVDKPDPTLTEGD